MDRINYNNVYVKFVNNKMDIEVIKVVQGEYSKLFFIVIVFNVVVYLEICN